MSASVKRLSGRRVSTVTRFGINDHQLVDKCSKRTVGKNRVTSSDKSSDQMSDHSAENYVPLSPKQRSGRSSAKMNGKNVRSVSDSKTKSVAKQTPTKRRLFIDIDGQSDKTDDNKRSLRQRNGSKEVEEVVNKLVPKGCTKKGLNKCLKTPKVLSKTNASLNKSTEKVMTKAKTIELNDKPEAVPKRIKKSISKKSKLVDTMTGDCLDLALERLSTKSIPESLPCRESEFRDIFNYVESKLIEGNGGCMYISGVPGTGKTATVREVRRKLESNDKYPKFTFIEINGLKLSDPFQCYVQIHYELTGQKKSTYAAADALNDRFSSADPDNQFVILFVDELDLLRTRKQNILYHLFDWPTRQYSKLIVLAIANSMDLPEKLMINRVSSRLGLTRLSFHPYSYKELEAIINSRLDELSQVFDGDALQLVCRKVAAVSGDARRALDICRLSVQMAQMAAEVQVSLKSVDTALQEIFNSLKLVRIRSATLHEKLFLQSIVQQFRISGVEECNFIDIYKHHIEMCHFEGHYTPSTVELERIAYNLHSCRLIILEKSGSHLYKRIRLNVSVDDINFALKM